MSGALEVVKDEDHLLAVRDCIVFGFAEAFNFEASDTYQLLGLCRWFAETYRQLVEAGVMEKFDFDKCCSSLSIDKDRVEEAYNTIKAYMVSSGLLKENEKGEYSYANDKFNGKRRF